MYLLSSQDGDRNVADGQILVLSVAQTKVPDLDEARCGPSWGDDGGLMLPLCLGEKERRAWQRKSDLTV